jgi:hypothetical protein
MDFNADIAARRRQQKESAQSHAAFLRSQEMELARFNELGKKFARWVKLSGEPPTRRKSVPIPGAPLVVVGRGRNKHTVTQTRDIGVWVFATRSEPDESRSGASYANVDEVAIDENGEITWRASKAKTAPELWNYIANFIASSGSTIRWPD